MTGYQLTPWIDAPDEYFCGVCAYAGYCIGLCSFCRPWHPCRVPGFARDDERTERYLNEWLTEHPDVVRVR